MCRFCVVRTFYRCFSLSVLSDNSPCSLVTIKGERGFVHHHLFYRPLDILPSRIYLFPSLSRLHSGSVLSAQSRHGFSIYPDNLSERITVQKLDSRTSSGSNTAQVILQQKRRKLPDLFKKKSPLMTEMYLQYNKECEHRRPAAAHVHHLFSVTDPTWSHIRFSKRLLRPGTFQAVISLFLQPVMESTCYWCRLLMKVQQRQKAPSANCSVSISRPGKKTYSGRKTLVLLWQSAPVKHGKLVTLYPAASQWPALWFFTASA